MAVEKPIVAGEAIIEEESPTSVSLVEDIGAEITPTEDGGAIVGNVGEEIAVDFSSNLAESIDDDELNNLSSELRQLYEDDKVFQSKFLILFTSSGVTISFVDSLLKYFSKFFLYLPSTLSHFVIPRITL